MNPAAPGQLEPTMAGVLESDEDAGGQRRDRRWRPADPGLTVGASIIVLFVAAAIFAPVVAPFDPNFQQPDGVTPLGEPLAPGDAKYLLGTDTFGRDLLSRLIYGSRAAIFIALIPNALALTLATAVGVTAGYFRGHVEMVLMRITETMMILPTFLLALALIAVLGSSLGVVILAITLVGWTYPARVVYGEVLRIRESSYVEAARALGAGAPRTIVRHIIPQLRVLLVVYFTLNAAFMVLVEAGLSFLGFGIQPPTPSWGAMIGAAQDVLFWPWLMVLPGLCLALLSLGFYLLGNSIQRRFGAAVRQVRL